MTRELKEDVIRTNQKIDFLKKQIAEVSDPREKHQLQGKLKELRYLQLWHLKRMGRQEVS